MSAFPRGCRTAVPHRRAADQPALDELLPSPVHAYYQNREQINGGRNNRYVAV